MTLEKIFADVFAIPVDTISDTLSLREIGSWDSMSHMVLITRIEEAFLVQLTGDQIADMKTVGDARLALRAHGIDL